MNAAEIAALLYRLDLGPQNAGAWCGSQGWAAGLATELITVRSPASGTQLAQVRAASADDLDHILDSAVAAAAVAR